MKRNFLTLLLISLLPTDWLWTWAKCSHKANHKNEALGAMHSTLCSRQLFSENLSKIVHFCPLAISPRTQISGGGNGKTIWQSNLGLKFESNQQRNIICKLKAEAGMPFRKGRAKVRIGILWIDLDIDVCRRNYKQILNKICNIFQFIFAFDNLLDSMQAKVRINKL